jgi:hypothetical protein
MRILALDPGETTGWAYTNTRWVGEGEAKLYHGDFRGWEDLEAFIRGSAFPLSPPATEHPTDVVIIEKFVLYPWAGAQQTWSDFPTIEVIGVAKFLAAKVDARVVMQPASDAKSKWIKRAPVKGNRHEKDAQRHLLVFLKREGLDGPYAEYYPRARKRS